MNRKQKVSSVKTLSQDFQNHSVVLAAHYAGLTVSQMTTLRSKMREAGVTVKVAKNRLVKIAIKGTDYTSMDGLLKGPAILAFGQDPVAVSKIANDFAKTNTSFKILGGGLNGKALSVSEIDVLSKLPSMNELRSKIIGLIQAPATKVAGVLQAPAGQLARVIMAKSTKDAA